MIPEDNDGATFWVPLHHLKQLYLDGEFYPAFQLLRRLDYPGTMDMIGLTFFDCTVEEILGILGPYLQNYIRCDGRFQDGLVILSSSSLGLISICTTTTTNTDGPSLLSKRKPTFLMCEVILQEEPTPEARDKLCIDLAVHAPREHVVCFEGDMHSDAAKGLIAAMPKLDELRLLNVTFSDGFLQPDPDGPHANTKLLPSLRYLHLEDIDNNDWCHLISYLAHQTSGGQVVSLRIAEKPVHICSAVVESIKGLVKEFVLESILVEECPFGVCQKDGGRRMTME